MRKSKKSSIVVPAEELAADRPPLMNRLADLQWVPGAVARVRRIGTGGNDLAGGIYPLEYIRPAYFDEVIGEEHGGGTYEVRFHIGNRPLLLRDGRLETYILKIAGEPKTREEELSIGEALAWLVEKMLTPLSGSGESDAESDQDRISK